MTTFKTTPEQQLQLATIMVEMNDAGLPAVFITRCADLARDDQGVFDLMELWFEEEVEEDRGEIVADLQEILDEDDELPPRPLKKPAIRYGQLDDVASRVSEHKEKLRRLVDAHGGVTVVAEKAGMHQSALSRLLNSASMPRRTTLYRIANALDVPETEVVTDFVR